MLKLLPDGPPHASWLTDEEKERFRAPYGRRYVGDHDLWEALRDPRVFALGLVLFGVICGEYGIFFWLPQIVQGMGFSNLATGFVVALPFVMGIAAMIFLGAFKR